MILFSNTGINKYKLPNKRNCSLYAKVTNQIPRMKLNIFITQVCFYNSLFRKCQKSRDGLIYKEARCFQIKTGAVSNVTENHNNLKSDRI